MRAKGVWPSQSDAMTTARHFNAGFNPPRFQVPEGRLRFADEMEGHGGNIVPFILPSLRDLCRCQRIPGAETPGYYRVVPLGRTRCGWDSRAPNAAGATGRVARPVKYSGDNGKPWRGALFHRARRTMLGDGRFAPLPIAASRMGLLGGTVATVGFPDIGLQGFAPGKVTGDA